MMRLDNKLGEDEKWVMLAGWGLLLVVGPTDVAKLAVISLLGEGSYLKDQLGRYI